MQDISSGETVFVLFNIILGSVTIMAALGIILITKSQLARSWFLIGIAVGFFVIKEMFRLLGIRVISGLAEFLFILVLAISVFYQYKVISNISKKIPKAG